jgi:hypothetical protein
MDRLRTTESRGKVKLTTDPFFIEKLRDVVGLYLRPGRTLWCCA